MGSSPGTPPPGTPRSPDRSARLPPGDESAMNEPIAGIHHVTAIATDPQRNLDFYAGVLGLRLVKRTVNFDDPGTYHFYYGDALGRPGTILTFFPWPGARRGSRGSGQATVTSFSVPAGALGFWQERLRRSGVIAEEPKTRFDEELIAFYDPDGLKLEVVAHPGAPGGESPMTRHRRRGAAPSWTRDSIPPKFSTGGTSTRSTSGSRGAFSSSSRPSARASRVTKSPRLWAPHSSCRRGWSPTASASSRRCLPSPCPRGRRPAASERPAFERARRGPPA
jgi:catechol 2,3-dioxygenase-like lactoylglutathione lyase family enzyme